MLTFVFMTPRNPFLSDRRGWGCRPGRRNRANVFRHFADKREVLFQGEVALRALLIKGVAEAAEPFQPFKSLLQAFRSIEPLLQANRPFMDLARSIFAETPSLQEREAAKIASLVRALAEALRGRGVSDQMALVRCADRDGYLVRSDSPLV